MKKKPLPSKTAIAGLRRRAETRLTARQKERQPKNGAHRSSVDPQRLVHELQVHQVELEMQKEELQRARDAMEVGLEKYTELYDFAPVGYFSLDDQGRILEANLTGANLLGVERAQLMRRRLLQFVAPSHRPDFQDFMERSLTHGGKQVCEAKVLKGNGTSFWAGFNATSAGSHREAPRGCRVSMSDLTVLKRAEEAQRRVEALAAANEAANKEIVRRAAVETALRKSERAQGILLAEARVLHVQLRHVTRQILQAQENERKNISRELHDEVAQILAGINVQLAALTNATADNGPERRKRLGNARRLVGHSIDVVHRFARELRPTLLDDLGLIPALRAYIRDLPRHKRLRIRLTAFPGVEELDNRLRTVLYRVTQEALTNVVRHAHAHVATVRIRKIPNAVRLEVRDDGKSFLVDRVLAPGTYKRLGLLGMRERVEMVGGSLVIESAADQGTTVRAEVPVRRHNQKPKL